MRDYGHIIRMENILDSGTENLEKLNNMLDTLESELKDYKALKDYYLSNERNLDLSDDENGLIPGEISTGVLGEDYIFDFLGDERDTALRLIELGLKMLKNE